MAKRKRSAPALSASVPSAMPDTPRPAAPEGLDVSEDSKIPRRRRTAASASLQDVAGSMPVKARPRGANSAHINNQQNGLHGHNNKAKAARRSSPSHGQGAPGMHVSPGNTPRTVSPAPGSDLHRMPPGAGTAAAAGAGRANSSSNASAEVVAGGVQQFNTVSSVHRDHGQTHTHAYEEEEAEASAARGATASTTKTRAKGATSHERQAHAPPQSLLETDTEKRPKAAPQSSINHQIEGIRGDDSPLATHPSGKPTSKIFEETVGVTVDPEDENGNRLDDEGDEEEVREALSGPPPVHSAYLPLPWKGRLGYACLNTYLRNATPPVFSSRTCRIASILEHRHPLKDPSQPEHATKNRPDKEKPADVARGQKYVEEIGLANARDIIKMLRWNDKYGIKFMRLSSEMFPFASHLEYGYKLAPFASHTLREVGKVVADLGHRVTTHPGQFTQLGSPRKEVIDASIRDLEYHDEMLSLMKLPPQQDRDAVMILHLGGVFGDKEATLDRFRKNYHRLSQSIKDRLVLENDDVSWSVHDVLPICQELDIPFVLDFHHHNIIFDAEKIREGTKDIVDLFPAILETWTKKGKTPKMHYSEPCPDAVTARSRRKHAPRVSTLPPCPDNMDLMIEAKDKEQAVFELMRAFKLPGFDLFNDVIPHVRQDENRSMRPKAKKAAKRGKKKAVKLEDEEENDDEDIGENDIDKATLVPDELVAMGGPENRVYWPPGMEDWLRPPKRVAKKKEDGAAAATAATRKRKATISGTATVNGVSEMVTKAGKAKSTPRKRVKKEALTPEDSEEGSSLVEMFDEREGSKASVKVNGVAKGARARRSGRTTGRVSYLEEEGDMSV